eukprot:TRINITY_DN2635_c0_g3_i2.p1 TRINITY_DN2635_c0_g3~~TRINITY_DN2635_c0_g3_i2.p1  ORF type:complete len:1173 (-),score=203.43 TRINITY_DN2635_c0_g3_i2:256-3774(-)
MMQPLSYLRVAWGADASKPISTEWRRFRVDGCDALRERRFCDNSITTAKYSVWTFLPMNLFEQFRRIANMYFLCIAILQVIPNVSPVDPWTSLLPLLFVLGVSAIKEAREDYLRHVQDKESNTRITLAYDSSQHAFVSRTWAELDVGHIIRVMNGEPLPADIVIVKTSLPDSVCYIETSNLDGETNLKIRQALPTTDVTLPNSSDRDSLLRCSIECEAPNGSLYKFEGNYKPNDTDTYALENKQVALRGCRIKNTEWVDGIVVFTGHDTKLMMNSIISKIKTSSIERQLNQNIISLFAFLIALCVICGILGGAFVSRERSNALYLHMEGIDEAAFGALNILTYIILFNTLIPISLYVSIELVKVVQAYLIECDITMYHDETDTPARARTSNLSDELGEIQYIFSDKTGTLTRNIMEFKSCSISGTVYPAEVKKSSGEGCTYWNPDLEALLGHPSSEQSETGHLFFYALSLCHTAIPQLNDKNPENVNAITYQSSSPDEVALLQAARDMGFAFKSRSPNEVTLVMDDDHTEVWEILNVIEFTSARKRMSVIFRSPQGAIILFCKGADVAIFPLLTSGQESTVKQMETNLQEYGNIGLRTLCIAYCQIDEGHYKSWAAQYARALVATANRDEEVETCGAKIENNLTLLGATAIEDRLQDGVPQCIHSLRKAGLKIWVLTGDKQETAINIGFSCKLLDSKMAILIINQQNGPEIEAQMDDAISRISSEQEKQNRQEIGLVIDGHALGYLLQSQGQRLANMATQCKSVICCRVSPSQKAAVVKLIKSNISATTLAIGDGANDVPMIKQAHIGIGISGQEGMQAVMASDYAISQFRFLKTLLLVHGRWSYIRICQLVRYCFYKNLCFSLVSLWFSIYTGFSGQTLHESMYIALFNVIFTSLPIMLLGTLDQDISRHMMERYPQLYSYRQYTDTFNVKSFWIWLGNGMIHSLFCFFIPYTLCKNVTTIMEDGKSGIHDIWSLGTLTYSCVIVLVNIKVAFMTTYWTVYSAIIFVASILSWFLFALTYHSIDLPTTAATYGVIFEIGKSPTFWLIILFTSLGAIVFDFVCTAIYHDIFPSNTLLVQEMERLQRGPSILNPTNFQGTINPPFETNVNSAPIAPHTENGASDVPLPPSSGKSGPSESSQKKSSGWHLSIVDDDETIANTSIPVGQPSNPSC